MEVLRTLKSEGVDVTLVQSLIPANFTFPVYKNALVSLNKASLAGKEHSSLFHVLTPLAYDVVHKRCFLHVADRKHGK